MFFVKQLRAILYFHMESVSEFKLWMSEQIVGWFNIHKSQNRGDAAATGSKIGKTTGSSR